MSFFEGLDQNNNKWNQSSSSNDEYNNDNETDNETDNEDNDTPPPNMNQEFIDKALDVKHTLYDKIVLGPELDTKEAQSHKILQDYLGKLNNVYILAIEAQNPNNTAISESKLQIFPEDVRPKIKLLLDWISDYFRKNTIPDTIPYSDFIRSNLRDLPFDQRVSFD